MNSRFIHFSAVALRLLAIALLLALPVGSGIAYAIAWAKHDYPQVFAQSFLGATSVGYGVEKGSIIFFYSHNWVGTPPPRGDQWVLPGLTVIRNVFMFTDDIGGDTKLSVEVRWWLLLLANLPPLLIALRLGWPMLRRRHSPGHCPNCGYDLRATPDRCPECGAAPAAGAA